MTRLAALAAACALLMALTAPAGAHEPAGAEEGRPGGAGSEVLVKLADLSLLTGDVADLPSVNEVANVIDGIDVHVVRVDPGTAESVAATLDALPVVEFAEVNGTVEPLTVDRRLAGLGKPFLPMHSMLLIDLGLGTAEEELAPAAEPAAEEAPQQVERAEAQVQDAVPNDPMLADQYALDRIDAHEAWATYREARGYGAEYPSQGGATIAILDSGIDQLHPEFGGKVGSCASYLLHIGVGLPTCQDNNFHGTHVAGVAGATANNGTGIAGVAFDSQLLPMQTCTVICSFADLAAATVHAADAGADVINYSLGGAEPNRTMEDAVDYAAERNALLVAAAGNRGGVDSVDYPAAFDRVLAVGSTNADDALSMFSSTGSQIDIAAPGEAILSTIPPAGLLYAEFDGTSMAAPHVAGAGALLRSLGLNAAQAREALIAGAEDVGLPREEQGAGRLNVANSVDHALGR